MAARIEVRGQSELGRLAADLKAAGDPARGLRRDFYRGLQRSAEPMIRAAREEARRLPKGGGLAEYVEANLKGRVSTTSTRVRVVFSAPSQAAAAFKAARRKDVRRTRRNERERLMTPEQRAAREQLRSNKRRDAALRRAAVRQRRRANWSG